MSVKTTTNNPIKTITTKSTKLDTSLDLDTKTTKLLAKSLCSLRENLTDLSLDSFLKNTLETIMQIERDEYLSQIDDPQIDKGNGYYGRAFNNLSKNSMLINVPRTRSGSLSLNTLELLKINREKLDEITLNLYKKGLTFEDIQDFLGETFDHSFSPTTITELTKVFAKFREAWFNSPLENHYKVVFADVIFVTVKRDNSYSKEGVFVATGVRQDNRRELLVLDINPTEGASNWGELLLDLRDRRGVKQIDLFVADGLAGLEDELAKVYPQALFQKCVIHKMRGILNKVKPKHKTEIAFDLKEVFNNFESTDTIDKTLIKVTRFLEKWGSIYPSVKTQLDPKNPNSKLEHYFTYVQFHPQVRRMIYTSNSIENLNRQIRKATKNKLSFESPDSLLDYLFMIIKDFEEKNYMKYPVSNYQHFSLFQLPSDTI
jgi:putative transposase